MDQTKLTSLITSLEQYSTLHPRRYRLRVALLAALGYSYLATVVIALLAIIYITLVYVRFSAVTVKLIWIPLVLVGLILRSLWVTVPEPDGVPLTEADAPQLFALISEIQKKLDGPSVHKVLLSDEFNAGIVQIPRLGMLGWLKNYLIVGLPFLTVMGPDQMRAALAHEFGHLSGKHGFGWVYRVRDSWTQILTAVHQERSYASFLFEPFLNWYAPFFKAYSFVLARLQEYEADRMAAKLAGREGIARCLVQMSLTGRRISDEFWPQFYDGAREQAQAPKDPFSQFIQTLRENKSQTNATKWFLQELTVPTGYEDTHPALADRLIALGFEKESLTSPATIKQLAAEQTSVDESAAHHYLTAIPEEFIGRSNRLWREQLVGAWRERHLEIETSRKRLTELANEAETRELSEEEQWEHAGHVKEVEGLEAGQAAMEQFVGRFPENAMGNLVLGSLLLDKDDATGLPIVEKAIRTNPTLTGTGYGAIASYYLGQGRFKEAEDYIARANSYFEEYYRLMSDAYAPPSGDDHLIPHGLPAQELEILRAQLAKTHGLARAFLVRKQVEAPEPVYVMGVIADFTWRDGVNAKHVDALLDEITATVSLNHPTQFVSLDARRDLIPSLAKVADSTIFARDGIVEAEIEMRH